MGLDSTYTDRHVPCEDYRGPLAAPVALHRQQRLDVEPAPGLCRESSQSLHDLTGERIELSRLNILATIPPGYAWELASVLSAYEVLDAFGFDEEGANRTVPNACKLRVSTFRLEQAREDGRLQEFYDLLAGILRGKIATYGGTVGKDCIAQTERLLPHTDQTGGRILERQAVASDIDQILGFGSGDAYYFNTHGVRDGLAVALSYIDFQTRELQGSRRWNAEVDDTLFRRTRELKITNTREILREARKQGHLALHWPYSSLAETVVRIAMDEGCELPPSVSQSWASEGNNHSQRSAQTQEFAQAIRKWAADPIGFDSEADEYAAEVDRLRALHASSGDARDLRQWLGSGAAFKTLEGIATVARAYALSELTIDLDRVDRWHRLARRYGLDERTDLRSMTPEKLIMIGREFGEISDYGALPTILASIRAEWLKAAHASELIILRQGGARIRSPQPEIIFLDGSSVGVDDEMLLAREELLGEVADPALAELLADEAAFIQRQDRAAINTFLLRQKYGIGVPVVLLEDEMGHPLPMLERHDDTEVHIGLAQVIVAYLAAVNDPQVSREDKVALTGYLASLSY